MKILLSLAFIFLMSNLHAQYLPDITARTGTGTIAIGSDSVFPVQTKSDTSFVLLLVSDTGISNYRKVVVAEYADRFNNSCYWIRAYKVKEMMWEYYNPLGYGYISGMSHYSWVCKSYYYIDYQKIKLGNNIIVWMSRDN